MLLDYLFYLKHLLGVFINHYFLIFYLNVLEFQNHHLIKRTVDSGDGTPFVQLIQTWDENGRLIKKEEMGSVITYQYDEQGRLLRELAGESETVSKIYIYYEDGSYKVESVSDPENNYSIILF